MKRSKRIVEDYLGDLRRIRASGGATGERSGYGPLANLLNDGWRRAESPRCSALANWRTRGPGIRTSGCIAAKQVQRGGQPRDDQLPEHGVVEVKSAEDDAWLTADS